MSRDKVREKNLGTGKGLGKRRVRELEKWEECYFVSGPRLEAEIALSAPTRKINIAHICHSFSISRSLSRPFLTLIILS